MKLHRRDTGFAHPLSLQHFLADGLEEMGLAQPHAAVNEQRVVRPCRFFGHRDASRMGKLIARAGDELCRMCNPG